MPSMGWTFFHLSLIKTTEKCGVGLFSTAIPSSKTTLPCFKLTKPNQHSASWEKRTCCQTWQPEFHPRNICPHCGQREETPTSCPLMFPCTMNVKYFSVICNISNFTVHKYDFYLSCAEGNLFSHLLNGNNYIWRMTVTGRCKWPILVSGTYVIVSLYLVPVKINLVSSVFHAHH